MSYLFNPQEDYGTFTDSVWAITGFTRVLADPERELTPGSRELWKHKAVDLLTWYGDWLIRFCDDDLVKLVDNFQEDIWLGFEEPLRNIRKLRERQKSPTFMEEEQVQDRHLNIFSKILVMLDKRIKPEDLLPFHHVKDSLVTVSDYLWLLENLLKTPEENRSSREERVVNHLCFHMEHFAVCATFLAKLNHQQKTLFFTEFEERRRNLGRPCVSYPSAGQIIPKIKFSNNEVCQKLQTQKIDFWSLSVFYRAFAAFSSDIPLSLFPDFS